MPLHASSSKLLQLLAASNELALVKRTLGSQLQLALTEKSDAVTALKSKANVLEAKAAALEVEVIQMKQSLDTITKLSFAAESAVATWKSRFESTNRLLDAAVQDRAACAAELGQVLALYHELQHDSKQQPPSSSSSRQKHGLDGAGFDTPPSIPAMPLPDLVIALVASKSTVESHLYQSKHAFYCIWNTL